MIQSPWGEAVYVASSREGEIAQRLVDLGLLPGPLTRGAWGRASMNSVLRSAVESSVPAGAFGEPGRECHRLQGSAGDRDIQIRLDPLSGNRYVIGEISAPEPMEEVRRGGSATVTWTRPRSFAKARRAGGGGLYLIERSRDGKTWIPDYAGQTNRYASRLATHARHRARPRGGMKYRVRLGTITGMYPGKKLSSMTAKQRKNHFRTVNMTVEHGVVRTLLRNGWALKNRSSIRPLIATARGFSIKHKGGPGYLPGTKVKAGGMLET